MALKSKGRNREKSVPENGHSVDSEEESKHFQDVANAFRYYRIYSMKRIALAEKYFLDLPAHHQELLPNFREHHHQVQLCVDHNYEVIKKIIEFTDHIFENVHHSADADKSVKASSEFNMNKVKTTLKQLMRDWSADGAAEREACYTPVVNEIVKQFPPEQCSIDTVKILVPGAGLGRLTFEIAKQGYCCQGNEFSLYMLFASNFVLNQCRERNMFTLYPWVNQYSNNMTSADQLRPIAIPDTNTSDLNPSAGFSMAAGDFLEVYTEPDCWDCVATVFFIDTAHNIIAYIETIYNILKPGGIWINFGPLLYHFDDLAGESSIELSYEDVRSIILKFNFEILKEETHVPATYTQNERSMLKYQYDCVFLVVRKASDDKCS